MTPDSDAVLMHTLSPEEAATLEHDRRASMRWRVRTVAWWLVGAAPLVSLFVWFAPAPPGAPPSAIQTLRIAGLIATSVLTLLWVGIAWWCASPRPYRWVRLWALVLLLTATLGPTVSSAFVVFYNTGLAPNTEPASIMAARSLMGSWAVFSAAAILIFVPWSVREVVVASLAVGGLILALSLPAFFSDPNYMDSIDTLLNIVLLTLISVGIGFSRAHSRREAFGRASMGQRVAKVTQELEIAREVHDAVFPRATLASGWAFDFHYEPMQQIGGDYAFLRPVARPQSHGRGDGGASGGPGGVIAGLIDVTGHGIASALTVNRLHGEIDRFLADHPNAGPEELLANLNRYLHHTLSEKSIFATAVCVRCEGDASGTGDSIGRVDFASAGHPPLMLKRGEPSGGGVLGVGGVESFGATGPVLGALPPEVFELRRQTITLEPGDRLLAFTDGILEARRDDGQMLWVEGVRGLVATLGPGPAGSQLSAAVRAYRRGPALDDVLVMEVARAERGSEGPGIEEANT